MSRSSKRPMHSELTGAGRHSRTALSFEALEPRTVLSASFGPMPESRLDYVYPVESPPPAAFTSVDGAGRLGQQGFDGSVSPELFRGTELGSPYQRHEVRRPAQIRYVLITASPIGWTSGADNVADPEALRSPPIRSATTEARSAQATPLTQSREVDSPSATAILPVPVFDVEPAPSADNASRLFEEPYLSYASVRSIDYRADRSNLGLPQNVERASAARRTDAEYVNLVPHALYDDDADAIEDWNSQKQAVSRIISELTMDSTVRTSYQEQLPIDRPGGAADDREDKSDDPGEGAASTSASDSSGLIILHPVQFTDDDATAPVDAAFDGYPRQACVLSWPSLLILPSTSTRPFHRPPKRPTRVVVQLDEKTTPATPQELTGVHMATLKRPRASSRAARSLSD